MHTETLFYPLTESGSSLHVRLTGGGPYTLFCVHGEQGGYQSFSTLEEYAVWLHARVVTMDLPGYGQSSRQGAGQSATDLAAELTDAIELLRLDNLVVVAHGTGAAIGIELCERLPERISGFINCEGILDAGSISRGNVRYLGDKTGGPRRVGRQLFDRYMSLSVPCMYISGTKSGGNGAAETLRKSGALLYELEGAGHDLMTDKPQAFAEAVDDFLTALAARPRETRRSQLRVNSRN